MLFNTYVELNKMIMSFKKVAATVASAVLLTGLVASPVFASQNVFNPGVYVFDDFNKEKTILQPEKGSYWWIDGQGTLPDGSAARVRGEDNCDLQTCVHLFDQDDNNEGFVRLQNFPTTTTVNYTNANLSEQIDGADGDPVYGGQAYPGEWNPTSNHPVVMEARMRFGPNFNIDGTGGARGTAGVWLWDAPFSQGAPNPFAIYDGIGFSWTSVDSEIMQGLTMMVTKGAFPVFVQPVSANININDWNDYKIVWSQDELGNQSVAYYINGIFQTSTSMPAGVFTLQNLGLEVWGDNQAYKPSEYPNYIQRVIIPEEKHFDLNSVLIMKM